MAFRPSNILAFTITFQLGNGTESIMEFGPGEYIEILSIDRHIASVERMLGIPVLHAIVKIDTDRFIPEKEA